MFSGWRQVQEREWTQIFLRPRLGSGMLSLYILLAKINHKPSPSSRDGETDSILEGRRWKVTSQREWIGEGVEMWCRVQVSQLASPGLGWEPRPSALLCALPAPSSPVAAGSLGWGEGHSG